MLSKIVGLGLLLVVVVYLARTCFFAGALLEVEKFSVFDIDQSAAVERLSQAVQIKTISWSASAPAEAEAFNDLNQLFESNYPLVHSRLVMTPILEHSRLYQWQGSDPSLEPLLMLAHTDVVPVANPSAWSVAPFSGETQNGYIYGRGTLDDKGSAVALLEAFERLLKEGFTPKRTIYLSLGHDEEVGGRAAQEVAARFKKQGQRFAAVIDEGGLVVSGAMPGVSGPIAMIGVAEKGYLTLQLTSAGEGGHSSMPPPSSAVGRLAAALTRLEENPFPARLQSPTADTFAAVAPHFPWLERSLFANLWLTEPVILSGLSKARSTNALIRTTTAVTVFNGGTKDNVMPPSATALVNFRLLPGDTIESATDYVKQVIDDSGIVVRKVEFGGEASRVSDIVDPTFGWMKKVVSKSLSGEVYVSPNLVAGATDARHFGELSDHVYRFLPFRSRKEDLPRFHGVDERLPIDSYVEGIGFYYHLLSNSADIR